MPKRTKHKGSGKYSARGRVGDIELTLSGKTSTISVNRTDSEQQQLLDRIKAWRAAAAEEFKASARDLMRVFGAFSCALNSRQRLLRGARLRPGNVR